MSVSSSAPVKSAAAFIGEPAAIDRVYAQGRRQKLEALASFFPQVVTRETFDTLAPALRDTQVLFSTWGMPHLTASQLDALPNLRAAFYAAGSVQSFARPCIEREILVFSAWSANAIPVAQWTLAQILLANKGYFRNEQEYRLARDPRRAFRGHGNFGTTVSLLGAGQIGRRVIEYLRAFELKVCVFDPFLSEAATTALGVEKVELDEAFACGNVVSNHLANLPATIGMLTGAHFRAMPPGATFINTGRGATVLETELVEVLQERRDLTALLDVTDPEPPRPDSPLWELPNAHLTTHLAGSLGDEVVRMADYMIEEFQVWQSGGPLRYNVTLEMLQTMA